VTFAVEILQSGDFAREAAARIALDLPGRGAVVLTGGSTVPSIYADLARSDAGWGDLEVFFSDERWVPEEDPRSNYGMARRTLLDRVGAARVHPVRYDGDPDTAAASYHDAVAAALPFDLVLLGMGSDCHVAALLPRSRALDAAERLCVVVERPDGMVGITLTPSALRPARRVLLLVAGRDKAAAVQRAVYGSEPPPECPVRVFADHPDATFLLDADAGALL
jgi:6-phosphogluconolactonase